MAASPQGPYTTKLITSSGVISTAGVGGYVKSFCINVAEAASSFTLKDGGTGGTSMVNLYGDGANVGQENRSYPSGDIGPIRFNTDIYGTLAGSGATGWVVYCEDES